MSRIVCAGPPPPARPAQAERGWSLNVRRSSARQIRELESDNPSTGGLRAWQPLGITPRSRARSPWSRNGPGGRARELVVYSQAGTARVQRAARADRTAAAAGTGATTIHSQFDTAAQKLVDRIESVSRERRQLEQNLDAFTRVCLRRGLGGVRPLNFPGEGLGQVINAGSRPRRPWLLRCPGAGSDLPRQAEAAGIVTYRRHRPRADLFTATSAASRTRRSDHKRAAGGTVERSVHGPRGRANDSAPGRGTAADRKLRQARQTIADMEDASHSAATPGCSRSCRERKNTLCLKKLNEDIAGSNSS